MEYRTWPELDAKVSLLGFGCMRFPVDESGAVREEETRAMVHRALEAGVNYIDTAYNYLNGQSEAVLGRILADVPRERYYLATKLPVWKARNAEEAERIFQEQLERTKAGYFDFYLLHALNSERWHKVLEQGILDWCIQKQKEGKARRLGFSFHDKYEVFEEILTHRKWDFCQIQFNYLDTEIQAGERGYELAKRLGVPVVVMEPVKGGALANPPEDLAQKMRRARPESTPASWAVRWVGGHDQVLTVLSGMSTMEQVEDNGKTFSPFVPLDCGEKALMQDVAEQLRQRTRNGCTGCRYCMPCPMGVDIPGVFECWNLAAKCEGGTAAWRPWNVLYSAAEKPDHCVRCGTCVELCPQGIPIPDDLARAKAELDAIPKP